jgi:hypothetical protein
MMPSLVLTFALLCVVVQILSVLNAHFQSYYAYTTETSPIIAYSFVDG